MTLTRFTSETQRQFIERELVDHGEVRVWDLLYNTYWNGGGKCSITRTASIIHALRREGWKISTDQQAGKVARYVLRDRPSRDFTEPSPRRNIEPTEGRKPRECPACKEWHPVGTTCRMRS